MSRILALLTSVFILGCPSAVPAGGTDDVAAATQAWIDAMNSRDGDRVVRLYDAEAVLWGTRSSTIRDNPAAIRDDFNILRTAPPSYNVVVGEQRIRVYGDIAINSGTYTFPRFVTASRSRFPRDSASSIKAVTDGGLSSTTTRPRYRHLGNSPLALW